MRFSSQIVKSAGRVGSMFIYSIVFLILITWNAALVYILITKIHMNDFGKFYYSAQAFMHGGDMYGPSAATFLPINSFLWAHFWNLNPPHFHFLILPFALLPPTLALGAWAFVNLIALIGSLVLIAKELQIALKPWPIALLILAFLGFSGTGSLALSGQMTLLLLPPLTMAWIKARHKQWGHAGIYLGLAMSLKLFLLLFMLYLLMCRQFRAATIACGTQILCYFIGGLIFGLEAYRSWLSALQAVDWMAQTHNASILGFLSRTFLENPNCEPITILKSVPQLWLLSVILIMLITMWVIKTDQSSTAVDRGFALILISALLISPLGWIYYLFLPLGPIAALAHSHQLSKEVTQGHYPAYQAWAKHVLLGISVPGLFLPPQLSLSLQPNPLATLFVANMYFWTLLALWLILLIDWKNAQPRPAFSISQSVPLGSTR